MAPYGASVNLLNRLENDLSKKEAELEKAESERDALVERLCEREERICELQQELEEEVTYRTRVWTLNKKLKSVQGELRGCQNARDSLVKEHGDVCKVRKQQEERLHSLTSELELCQSDKAALLQEKVHACEIRKEQEERLKEERKGFQDALDKLQDEKNSVGEALEREQQKAALQSTIQAAMIQELERKLEEEHSANRSIPRIVKRPKLTEQPPRPRGVKRRRADSSESDLNNQV